MRLERTIELDAPRLELFDWPGRGGPLVHIADPLAPSLDLVSALAQSHVPRLRVMSLVSRGDAPYQVHVMDVLGVLEQFGFSQVELIGERLGAVVALLCAAWCADRFARLTRLTLYTPAYTTDSETLFGRSLRDCPPDWPTLRRTITCPIEERV